MPFWPFRKSPPEILTPVELRDRLIQTAAAGSHRKLRSLCKSYQREIALHVDTLRKIPDGMPTDDGSIDRYFQCLVTVAHCLAQECAAPELWNALSGNADDNPLAQWNRWFEEMPERMKRLDYDLLIDEAKGFLERAKTLRGATARRYESFLYGRLGELLYHSGRVGDAVQECQSALDLCVTNSDAEGQLAYLNNLLEIHCYLNDGLALQTAERIRDVREKTGAPTRDICRKIERLKTGEPLCRVVCVRDGRELELDEIGEVGEGRYEFQFRRNRIPLQKSMILTGQGNQLASSDQFADALEKYREASEVDPHDPDPVYQSGMCLLELGAFSQARETFEEVERLAPGWFRCRTDRWLALGLERGTISDEAFRILRVLEDGGLAAAQAAPLAQQALERFPDFAPLYLIRGDLHRDGGDSQLAAAAYRRGLELVSEPDLESRLLCALAGILPDKSPERYQLVDRALKIDGSLVAQATARLIGLR